MCFDRRLVYYTVVHAGTKALNRNGVKVEYTEQEESVVINNLQDLWNGREKQEFVRIKLKGLFLHNYCKGQSLKRQDIFSLF